VKTSIPIGLRETKTTENHRLNARKRRIIRQLLTLAKKGLNGMFQKWQGKGYLPIEPFKMPLERKNLARQE
jgi:hypothetical protein